MSEATKPEFDPTSTPSMFDPTAAAGGISDGGEEELFAVELEPEIKIQPGMYPAMLTGLEKDVSSSGNDMWVWKFTIREGVCAGRSLMVYTALTASAAWKLAQVVRGLQLPMENNKAKFSKKDAIGRYAMIQVTNTTYQGQERANIENVKPWPKDRPLPNGGEPTPF